MRIAIICHEPVVTGGFLRFVRFGNEALKYGHEIVFVKYSPDPGSYALGDFPFGLINIEQAMDSEWDFTMVPGAGFPDSTIHGLSCLQASQFGVRIQHILNDRSRRERFELVNKSYAPHVVIFNNRDWIPGSFTSLTAGSFWHLEGAVSLPSPGRGKMRPLPSLDRPLVVGGLINKNPNPLLASLVQYRAPIKARLYGMPSKIDPAYQYLIDGGVVELCGLIDIRNLSEFYESVDCVVHTEEFAGWSNLAAEALAHSVPLICTKHGTSSFAIDKCSAMVMSSPSPDNILDRLRIIHRNHDNIIESLTESGLKIISSYGWENYTRKLLDIADFGGNRYYTYAPCLGLHGKWPLKSRLKGLDFLIASSRNMSILDLGCSECVVAHSFLSEGAALAHCVDRDGCYIANGNKLLAEFPGSFAVKADISPWNVFMSSSVGQSLLPSYDIVLFLGVFHHLHESARQAVLEGAASLSSKYFAIRTTARVYEEGLVSELLVRLGFSKIHVDNGDSSVGSGSVRIYEKSKQ